MGLIDDVKKIIDSSERILIVTGAGISTGANIPDFRSKGGLYEMVGEKFGLADPTMIFDINYFLSNPSIFYEFAPTLVKDYQPTAAHKYIAELEKDHKVTVLTQNIDGLHIKAGSGNVITAHGTMAKTRCLTCGNVEDHPNYNGNVITCEMCGGLMKPDVVFFNEQLPNSFYDFYDNWGDYNFDLMIVVGTGLNVYPVAGLVFKINRYVKNTIYITKVGNERLNSIRITEDIQKVFKKLSKKGLLGFNIELDIFNFNLKL